MSRFSWNLVLLIFIGVAAVLFVYRGCAHAQELPCPPPGYAAPPGCPGGPPAPMPPPPVYYPPPVISFPPIIIGGGGWGGGWGGGGWGGGGWGHGGWGGGGGRRAPHHLKAHYRRCK